VQAMVPIDRLFVVLASLAWTACGSTQPTAATPAAVVPIEHLHDAGAAAVTDDTPAIVGAPAAQPAEPAPIVDPKVELLAAETAAWDTAKPVFDNACASCHTTAGKKVSKKKLDHFNMDAYPLGGHHAATIGFTIRDVLGISGKKPTMPANKPGSVKGDDLATIKAWTDAWEAAETGGAHPPAGGHHHH
jgi:mono/diheme cytochrome c family protein